MGAAVPGLRTMLWIGGKPNEIQDKFRQAEKENFQGLDQVQLHLKSDAGNQDEIQYLMNEDFLHEAIKITGEAKVDLEVLPFAFDCDSIANLLDTGIRWFATDEPKRFKSCIDDYFSQTQ